MSEKEPPINYPKITTLRGMQEVEAHFSSRINPTEGPFDIFRMLSGESDELREAIEKGGRKDVASELADVIILATKLATAYGIDVEEAISAKIARNFIKYNPHVVEELVGTGMEIREAVAHMKSNWDRTRDGDFMTQI